MRSERGQATVEWIAIVLLVTLALAALTRLAPSAEGRSLATTVLHSVTCAARNGCEHGRAAQRPRTARTAPRHEGFAVPPLVPHPGQMRLRARPPSGRAFLRWVRRAAGRMPAGESARVLAERLRRGAGLAWRRAWFACLVYERLRYAFLHPESRFPGHTIPPSEVLRIANDCISPADLVRDWPMLSGR